MSMVENISVQKAITCVLEGGINHKSVVVRTHVAMLVDHVISAIGPERFYGASKDIQVWITQTRQFFSAKISFFP